MTRTAFRIGGKRATMAALASALLIGGLPAAPVTADAAPAGPPGPLRAAPDASVYPTFELKTRVVASSPGQPEDRLKVTVGEETHQSPATGSWSCPTGVWVLQLERASLEVEASDSYPLCTEADTKVVTDTLKATSSERTVIVNSLNRAPGGDARTLKGLGKALAPIGVPADEFAAVNLAQTSFSVYGIPGLSAGQAYTAKGKLLEEAEVTVGSPTEASINGTLALDNNSKFTLTMSDYVLYDIAANGAIELHGHTYPVPAEPESFKGGFHLLVVDRRSLAPVSDTLYSTNDNPAGQYQLASDLNRLATGRGQTVLVFLATVGDPVGGRQLPAGPVNFPAPCSASAAFTVTCTYKPIGAEQRFTVPDQVAGYSVSNLHVTLQGGFGGYAKSGGEGGDPDRVVADLPVGEDEAIKPGQTIYVEVAGNGTSAGSVPAGRGGWNGGANGGASSGSSYYGWPGGGGGGASDIRTVSRTGADGNSSASLASRIVVAGGGGGAGGDSHDAGRGADGGDAGGAGGDGRHGSTSGGADGGRGGGPGTSSHGGPGGAGHKTGESGVLGVGAVGTATLGASGAAGGGGGGYFGGGAGGVGGGGGSYPHYNGGGGGGGGGGSNLVPAGGTVQPVTRHEPASVTISYQVPYGTLAQALRPFGATPTLVDALGSTPRYALAGMLNTPAAAALGLSADAPEASPRISAGATGRLQGVLQRGHQNMWYGSITSNAPVVRSINGTVQPSTVMNFELYHVISDVEERWPLPVADPGPVRDAQQAALTYLSRATCACDNIRDNYNASLSLINTRKEMIEATPFPTGQDFDQAAFDAVKAQLIKELRYVYVVGGLKQDMHMLLSDQEHMLQPALLKAYKEVRESVKVADHTELAVSIVSFILELFKSAAEAAEAHAFTAGLGVANAILKFSMEMSNEKGGEDEDALETTVNQLGQKTAESFAAALTSMSQTFNYLYEDWGKLSTVATGLLDGHDWDVSASDPGRYISVARDAIKLSFYRILTGLAYQRFEAQGAPTSDIDDWCLSGYRGHGQECLTAGSHYKFKRPSSAYTSPVHAPALGFEPVHDNILITTETSTWTGTHPLSPGLMKEMEESGLYAPYLFLRWSMIKGAICPVNFSIRPTSGETNTGTVFNCYVHSEGLGSPGPLPHPTATPNRVFKDAARDAHKGVDIRTVKVWNRRGQNAFHATLKGRHFAPKRADVAEFYLDVNRQRKGPEFVIRSWSNRDDDGHAGARLFRTRSDNRWLPGKRIACRALRVSWRVPLADEVRMGVLKRCVGGAGAFAVHARLWEVKDYKTRDRWVGWRDVAPKPHATYAWVMPKGKG